MSEQKNINGRERDDLDEEYEDINDEPNMVWHPLAEGEQLTGTIKKVGKGSYGKYLLIENELGDIYETPSHVVLQSKIEELVVGEKVRIRYLGKKSTRSGRKVNNYRLQRKRTDR